MHELQLYDFHARMLDNTIPGFTAPDPLAEQHPRESPYQFCGNNPVNRIDPTGLDWYAYSKGVSWFENMHTHEGFTYNDVQYKWIGEEVDLVNTAGDHFFGDMYGNLTKIIDIPEITVTPDGNYFNYLTGGGGGGSGVAEDSSQGVNSGDNLFFKTWAHYQFGGGKPLIVNTSSLNFSFVSQQNINKDGSVNLANPKIFGINALSSTALALGSITLKSQGNNRYKIEPDIYDFDIRWKNGFTFRNFATLGAGLLHGPVIDNIPIPLIFNFGIPIFGPSIYTGSGKFTIYFEGTVYIKP